MQLAPPKLLATPKRKMGFTGKNGHNSTPEHIMERRHKVYDMRLQGMSGKSIAKELGVSMNTVSEDLLAISRLKYEGLIEKDQQLLVEQNDTYEQLMERWLPLALSKDLVVGETREKKNGEIFDIQLKTWEASTEATKNVLKIMEGAAKINGLMNTKADKSAEEIGRNVAVTVFKAFQDLARKPIRAEVIKNELTDAGETDSTGIQPVDDTIQAS